MNSTAKTFLTAVVAVASAATMALVLAEQTAPQDLHTAVVQREPVRVQGPRSAAADAVVQLPRVVVAGRRSAAASAQELALACVPAARVC